MADLPRTDTISWRDGTSQSGRALRELSPRHALLDERTTRDLLDFARAYATELNYFPADDPSTARGDWSPFLDVDLDAAARYAGAVGSVPAGQEALFARPHFALLLTFLELVGLVRDRANDFSARHLEFFYQDVLRMVRRRAAPDQVHVLVELTARTPELFLPAGTALRAGKDSLGRDLVYRTRAALAASQVQVARASSLRVEVKRTGIREASREYLVQGTRDDAFVGMLRIALGQPTPGDPLPVPVYPGQAEPVVGFDVLVKAHDLLAVAKTQLGTPLFDDLRLLVRLKRLRDDNEAGDWKRINAILQKIGAAQSPPVAFAPKDLTDFQGNLLAVLKKTAAQYAKMYDGLPEVKSIEEAYEVYPDRPDVQEFIQKKLFLSLEDFRTLMGTKTVMDNQWAEIDGLLERAGRVSRGDPAYVFPDAARASRVFADKLKEAAPAFAAKWSLDSYYASFLALQDYFFMSAESFDFVMSVARRGTGAVAEDPDWEQVYEIVDGAHTRMVYARRRAALLAVAKPGVDAGDAKRALGDLLKVVIGRPLELPEALRALEPLKVAAADQQYLEGIAAGTAKADWERVVEILEVAQRNREDFREPVAEKVEWRNLYPAADATSVASAYAADGSVARWRTFGEGERPRAREPVPAATFGWGIASLLLDLSEGKRTVELTLGFSEAPESFDVAKLRALFAPTTAAPMVAAFNPFSLQLSTAKGWTEASATLAWKSADMVGYPVAKGAPASKLRTLVFTLTLAPTDPAPAPASAGIHGMESASPVLRLMVKPVWDELASAYVTSYQLLRGLVLVRARLGVAVDGLAKLTIANDRSTLDAKKPFEPFGIEPATGSRLYFGHRELVTRKLDSLGFDFTWMGAPEKLGDLYKNYPGTFDNTTFKAKVALVDRGQGVEFPTKLALFDAADARKPVSATLAAPAEQGSPGAAVTAPADVTAWSRYFTWELDTPDFQHSVYSSVALAMSLQLATTISKGTAPDPAAFQVNRPYTPKLKSLTVDYTASAELSFEPGAPSTTAALAFHVQPFGYLVPVAEPPLAGVPFLPHYELEGELYIGLRGVDAPQRVSLLFQVAEGSADPDLPPDPLVWSYLSGDRWESLGEGGLLADGTRGLVNSGIVELALPPALPGTVLPPELYWIRVGIARSTGCVSDLVAIQPNAVLATFEDAGNAPDHLADPLPAGRITAPVATLPGIARIRQPYSSFGGKMAEEDAGFRLRVSERLRHKQRALTAWDYERLVLGEFPDIYKVKCVEAGPGAQPREPGTVDLVVIPDMRNRMPFDPFEPKAPADALRDITAFLRDKTPPFATVRVRNPRYVPVKVRCGVRLMRGEDPGMRLRALGVELNRFLSPWAYDEGSDIVIGGSIYANSIIDFIEGRDYVDYVAGFKLFKSEDGGDTFEQCEGDYVRADARDSVLVAARQHDFDLISHADYRVEAFGGVGYLKIELDFSVA